MEAIISNNSDSPEGYSDTVISDNSDEEMEILEHLKPPPIEINEQILSTVQPKFQITVRTEKNHHKNGNEVTEISETEEHTIITITTSKILKTDYVPVIKQKNVSKCKKVPSVKVQNMFDNLSIEEIEHTIDNDVGTINKSDCDLEDNLDEESLTQGGAKKKTNKKKKRKKKNKNKDVSTSDQAPENEFKIFGETAKTRGARRKRNRTHKLQAAKPQQKESSTSSESGPSRTQNTSSRGDLITIEENIETGSTIRLSAKARIQLMRDIRKVNRETYGDQPKEIARRREYEVLRSMENQLLAAILLQSSDDDSDFDSDIVDESDFGDSDLEEYLNSYMF